MAEVPRGSLIQRLGARAMRTMSKVINGYDPVFVDEMLNILGTAGVRIWGERLTAVSIALDERFGHAKAQHIISFSAMLNGCPFCSIGHMYSANLQVFADSGLLFPVDEREVLKLQELGDEELLDVLEKRLAGGPHEETLALFKRVYALKFGGAEPETADDELFIAAIGAWDLLTECTILSEGIDPAKVDPLSEVAKDKGLRKRYQAARGRT